MLNNLLSNVLNGALCAVEQFISGIFAKVFDSLEKGFSIIMSGLKWVIRWIIFSNWSFDLVVLQVVF